MIIIGRSIVHPYLTNDSDTYFHTKEQILSTMTSNQEVYTYQSIDQLAFDLNVRAALVLACIDLYNSGIQFRTFKYSFCNEKYWQLTKHGGFQLKPGKKAAQAILDIFKNGAKYGTECATAMIVLLYRALLDVYSEETFNLLFSNLLLYTWDYDKDLKLITKTEGQIIPGDLSYFKNPQVNPDTMEWQGENVVYTGDDLYYGHGVGIKTEKQIIENLNLRRIPFAFLSAYLTNIITRIDYRLMNQYTSPSKIKTKIAIRPIRDDAVIATAGNTTVVF
ncbi:protein-glutamine gamma-glutamyltransferase [Bacillus sp. 165]|uniref:protein-glutamine gamma-glutamyltransferase n=1 Tax=Bacillus sp. 165 TaxID=1529117 RepID=UPI001ADD1EDE|nr:protein-glutamine gamma-glutamyltransferase [Bacillus sp. 165]MBO9130321.1 protein-glutamine gamma-glutamyltransferase [Bacillus sp. 165]